MRPSVSGGAMEPMKNEPLVSVVVIAYNSRDYVLETLQSVYDQTYRNLELIVADDCSSDDTAQLAKAWVSERQARFSRSIVRVNSENMGIPGNLNTAIDLAKGTYVKIIAADDLLLPDCIRVNAEACEEQKLQSLCTWLVKFSDTPEGRKQWTEQPNLGFFEADAETQKKMLLRKNQIYGSTFFFRKDYWQDLGKYDMRYRLLEDYPMFWKIACRGDRFHFVNVPTVAYRISETSISNGAGRRVVNVNYIRCYRQFFCDCIRPELLRRGMLLTLALHGRDFFYRRLIVRLGNDRARRSVRVAEYFHQRKYLPSRRNTL